VTRRDLGVIARLDLVALIGFASAKVDSDLMSAAMVLVLVAWPITIVIPMHWRGELDQDTAIRYSSFFLAVFAGIFVIAFGDAQEASYPSTALLFGFAAAHMVAVWLYLHARLSDLGAFPAWSVDVCCSSRARSPIYRARSDGTQWPSASTGS
jgi:hypothetical protein